MKSRIAYTAVLNDGRFQLGLAEENQPGYWPMPEHGTFESYAAAMDRAQELNRDRGLADDEAIRIVLSSMGAQAKGGAR